MAGSALARSRPSSSASVGSGVGLSRTHVSDIQRARLMAGAVAAIDELGYAEATVGRITARARVSRRTFYEMFAHRDECLAAVLDEAAGLVEAELVAAGVGRLVWRERVAAGLAAILAFLDREPALARVCVVHALRAGPVVLERRERIFARLTAVVDEGRRQGARGEGCTPLTAEGLVGAAFAIVQARLQRREHQPLSDLLGELMAMIVLPYLGSAAARRERTRRVARVAAAVSIPAAAPRGARDPLGNVRMRLTYRTARVLEGIARMGDEGETLPSNRQVAAYAGIADAGQVSKLLRRLERVGLLANIGEGHAKGEPNAWALTAQGRQVAQSIRAHGRFESEAA